MLKRVNFMSTTTTSRADINQQIDRCLLRMNQCSDVIKQLSGSTPNAFEFTFSVSGKEIVKFEIADDESEFNISYFMAWYQFYRNRMLALSRTLCML